VDNIFPIERIHEYVGQNLTININEGRTGIEELKQIRNVVDLHPGNCYLFFNITGNGTKKIFKSKEFRINPSSELISNLKQIVGEHNLNIN
jgi:hypothetical protein